MDFKNKTLINKRTNAIIGLFILAVTFIIYFITKPISLSFWDCGEYITCSSIFGVPHPPGNPFYIILGKFITLLPLGLSDAQSVSLLSIIFSSFAVLFAYLSIVKLVSIWEKKSIYCYFAGVIGAFFIAFSKEFWVNAIEAEVYGGLSFFISLIIWLTLVWTEKSKDFDHQNILLLIIFLFFLGFGVHQTTLQIAPAILFIVVLPLLKFDKGFFTKAVIYSVVAFTVYLLFHLIGASFGHGSLGKYAFAIFVVSLMIYYLRDYVEPKVWIFALFIIIIGLSTHLILPIRASAHAMILVMNLSISEVRDRPYFFITAYMLWSFWMGIGAMGIVKYFAKRIKALSMILLVIFFLLPVVNMASHYHKNDRSQELLSLEYGTNFLNGLDKNAIIFTNGDNDTFPLWYAQAVYDPNAKEYYLEDDTLTFKEVTGMSISEKSKGSTFGGKEMPTRTRRLLNQANIAKKDLKGIRKDVSVANLSLLNTPWYIKQLRDYEGIEINLTDQQIDALSPIKLSDDAVFKVGNIKVKLKKDTELYIKDQMVLQIIHDNFGKRPIYFAVTVASHVGFDDYLQSEGMADRLVETKGKYQIDPARLNHNIENVFDYSSIFNDELYKDSNMRRLINNYGADFMRMSTVFYRKKDYDNAIKYMKKALDFIQDKDRYIPSLSNLYYEIGDYENAYKTISPLIAKKPNDGQIVYLASTYLDKAGKIEDALSLLENFISNNPHEKYFVSRYVSICKNNKKYQQGLNFVNKILEENPQDKNLLKYKSEFENIIKGIGN